MSSVQGIDVGCELPNLLPQKDELRAASPSSLNEPSIIHYRIVRGGLEIPGENKRSNLCFSIAISWILIGCVFSTSAKGDTTDEFESGTIDSATWDITDAFDVYCSVEDGMLVIEGTRSGGGDWANSNTWTHVETTESFGTGIEIEFKYRVDGSGTGYGSGITLFQDSNNHIDIGPLYDPGGGSDVTLALGGRVDGSWLSVVRLDTRPINPSILHTFRIEYPKDGESVMFVDGNEMGTYIIDLDNFNIRLYGHTRQSGDYVRAEFDDFSVRKTSSAEDCSGGIDYVWFVLLLVLVVVELLVIVFLLTRKRNRP